MPKRIRLQDSRQDEENDVDEHEPVQTTSKNGKHSRQSSVIDSGYGSELARPEPTVSQREESIQPDISVQNKLSSDQTSKEISDRKITTFKKSDNVDATPPVLQLEELEEFEGTPSGIEADMPVSKTAEHYKMSHPKRGTCLVLNHDVFETFGAREGSNFDVERIDATFSRLGFDVVVHDNLKYAGVMEKIETLGKPENHVNNDCLCVFILTHGQANDYLLARDVAYTSDRIWKPFTADNCPTLAGKPKLFFFQACRGKKLDGGVRMMKRSDSNISHQTDSIVASYTLPTLADFLIAHSCAEGFFSWRDPETGTCYVQTLCDVLDEFAESMDLVKMLTITARRVATDYESFNDQIPQLNGQKQVPTVTSTLTRDLYFAPK